MGDAHGQTGTGALDAAEVDPSLPGGGQGRTAAGVCVCGKDQAVSLPAGLEECRHSHGAQK